MSKYVKPVVSLDEGMAEGVYAASGCYTVEAKIHQTPQTGRGDYRIQVDGYHNATHGNTAQTLTISFNQSVDYVSCNGSGAKCVGGNGTSTLIITLTYHQNFTENLGFGDLIVTSDPGLQITNVKLTDNA